MRFVQLALFSLFFVSQVQAQTVFKIREDSILHLFREFQNSQDDESRLNINSDIIRNFKSVLSQDGSFEYPFDSLKMAARIYAPDKAFRIISWNLLMSNGEYKYFGFIQTQSKKVFELTDRTDELTNLQNSVLSAGKWLGAFYYKILRNKVDNRIYYTLLSLQYHNVSINRKFVEILYFDQWGNPVFGAPIIQANGKSFHRLVLEYSSMVVVNLRYDEKLKMIIFDHLAPSEPQYTGLFQYYGPDLTFDGLKFEKNKWQYLSNLDLRRPFEPGVKKRTPR